MCLVRVQGSIRKGLGHKDPIRTLYSKPHKVGNRIKAK